MKANNKQISKKKGMTLLELTVVILVLLTLISVLFIGATAWKNGADRSNCILNIRNFQVAVRSYVNMNQYDPDDVEVGEEVDLSLTDGDIVGDGKFIDAEPTCPGNGTYTTNPVTATNVDPLDGSDDKATFLICDYTGGGEAHVPNDVTGW